MPAKNYTMKRLFKFIIAESDADFYKKTGINRIFFSFENSRAGAGNLIKFNALNTNFKIFDFVFLCMQEYPIHAGLKFLHTQE